VSKPNLGWVAEVFSTSPSGCEAGGRDFSPRRLGRVGGGGRNPLFHNLEGCGFVWLRRSDIFFAIFFFFFSYFFFLLLWLEIHFFVRLKLCAMGWAKSNPERVEIQTSRVRGWGGCCVEKILGKTLGS